MTVKDIIDKSQNCVILISKDGKIIADNVHILGDIEKYVNDEVVAISSFYARQGVYKFGIILGL